MPGNAQGHPNKTPQGWSKSDEDVNPRLAKSTIVAPTGGIEAGAGLDRLIDSCDLTLAQRGGNRSLRRGLIEVAKVAGTVFIDFCTLRTKSR